MRIAQGVLGWRQSECPAVGEFTQGLESPRDLPLASHIVEANVVTDSFGQLGAVDRWVTVEEAAHRRDRFWLSEDSLDLILFRHDSIADHQQGTSAVWTDRFGTAVGLC